MVFASMFSFGTHRLLIFVFFPQAPVAPRFIIALPILFTGHSGDWSQECSSDVNAESFGHTDESTYAIPVGMCRGFCITEAR
jgi:hypothetical protein